MSKASPHPRDRSQKRRLLIHSKAAGGRRPFITLLFSVDVCAVCAAGKGWLNALETHGLKRVGFWAPLPFETALSYCRSMERLRETRTVNSVRTVLVAGALAANLRGHQ